MSFKYGQVHAFFFSQLLKNNWLHWVLAVARGIYFPHQGWNLGPLHWEHRVLTTGPPGKSQEHDFL